MKSKPRITCCLALAMGLLATACSTTSTVQGPASGPIPDADALLRQMSDKLGSARQFTFTATRTINPSIAATHGLQADAKIEGAVKRPNDMRVTISNGKDVRTMIADGKNLTMLDSTENLYSTVPMNASLDAIPAKLTAKYSFEPPLASFIVSSPYKDVIGRGNKVSYAGTGDLLSGFLGSTKTPCHRIGLTTESGYAELWIATGDQLPRKLTLKPNGAVETALTIDFTAWNLNAIIDDGTFNFTPPKGSYAIPMITTDEMKAAKR